MNAFKAGAAYFALVYAIDYLLTRALFKIIELYMLDTSDLKILIFEQAKLNILMGYPLKLIAAWFVCRWLVRRFDIARGMNRSHAPGVMGAVAFLLLMLTNTLAISNTGTLNSLFPLIALYFFGTIPLALFPRFQAPRAKIDGVERV